MLVRYLLLSAVSLLNASLLPIMVRAALATIAVLLGVVGIGVVLSVFFSPSWWILSTLFLIVWILILPLLFVTLASFYSDSIATVIEQHYYPFVIPASSISIQQEIKHALIFFAHVIVFNLLCSPLYFIPGVNGLMFYAVNSWLVGREIFRVVAQRFISSTHVKQLTRAHYGMIWAMGLVILFASSIPLLNLLVPFYSIALAVHIYHGLPKSTPLAVN